MARTWSRTALFIGLTAIFIGYLTVWLPGPAAGLRFIGVEIGEWIKFLGVGRSRDLFYLPPISLGLMLSLIASTWPGRRWQNQAMRILGVGVSLLAFPAIEAIRFETSSEWLLRVQLISLVLLVSVVTGIVDLKQIDHRLHGLSNYLLVIMGVAGALLPAWIYLQVRPIVSQAIGLPIGIGPGVWLNGLGHLLVAVVSYYRIRK